MDVSNRTLYSFGDSFTYGDGLFPTEDFDLSNKLNVIYINKRLKNSYTGLLERTMRFARSVNYGIIANNNEYILSQVYREVNKPDFDPDKSFFLINLTDPARWAARSFNPNIYNLYNVHSLENLTFSGMNIENIQILATVLFDDYTNMMRYYNTLNAFKHLFNSVKVPYYMFSSINTIDDRINRYAELKQTWNKIEIPEVLFPNLVDDIPNILEQYEELVNSINHFETVRESIEPGPWPWDKNQRFRGGEDRKYMHNLVKVMDIYTANKYQSRNYYKKHMILPCGHWNLQGHKLAAQIIKSLIERQDYKYLGLN